MGAGSTTSSVNIPVDIIKYYIAIYTENLDMKRIFFAEKMRPSFNEEDIYYFSQSITACAIK